MVVLRLDGVNKIGYNHRVKKQEVQAFVYVSAQMDAVAETEKRKSGWIHQVTSFQATFRWLSFNSKLGRSTRFCVCRCLVFR